MSEPENRADRVHELAPGLWHWTLHDDRIDFRSEAYAVDTLDGRVLLDPLPLSDRALSLLRPVAGICITGPFHQRSAWRLRRACGVPVHAPRGASAMEEQPDFRFGDGDEPVPGLTAWLRQGPSQPHYVFLWRGSGGTTALFCGDLLVRAGDEPFRFAADDHQDDPARTREAARTLVGISAEWLCPAHGEPQRGHVGEEIRRALERDG